MQSFGDFSYKKQPGAKYSVAKNGLATYDVTYKGRGAFMLMQGAYSEDYPNVILMTFTVTETGDNCDMLEAALHYEGYDSSQSSAAVREDATLEVTSSQDPIETHPKFLTFAGSYNHEHNGAKFRPDGSFDFFTHNYPNDATLNPFAGISSYLYPREVFTTDRIDQDWPTSSEMSRLGHIIDLSQITQNSPPEAPSSIPSEKAWLFTGIRVRNIGNVYFETQRSASMSGPRGWNETIYKP